MATKKTAGRKRTKKAGGVKSKAKPAGKAARKKTAKAAARKVVRKATKKKVAKKAVKKAVKKAKRAATKSAVRPKAAKAKVKKAAPKKKATVKKAARPASRPGGKKGTKKAVRKPAGVAAKKKPAARKQPAPRTVVVEPRVVPPPPIEEPLGGSVPVIDVEPGLAGGSFEMFDANGRPGPTLFDVDDFEVEPRVAPAEPAEPPIPGPVTHPLAIGTPAPDFALPDGSGQTHTLASYRGQQVVLFFYPRDETPGCTRETCGFRDQYGAFHGRNVALLGVSPDEPGSHTRFAEKYGLPFPLLSDESHAVAERYGVWGARDSADGTTRTGMKRTTFIIDEDGIITQVFEDVRPGGHAEQVLDWLDRARRPEL
jgi:peroxiredoxin Q/BCP